MQGAKLFHEGHPEVRAALLQELGADRQFATDRQVAPAPGPEHGEHRICLAPVVLGGGNPLFKPQDQPLKMRLETARPLKTGGTILTYTVGQ